MSSGHSSRSSSSIRVSSGSRFLAKSWSDFKLNFSVFGVIMNASLGCFASQLANLAGQLRQKLQNVINNSDIGNLEDRGLGILVDGDDEGACLEAGQMLEGTANAARQIDLGFNCLAGGANLARFLQP